ncbi:unnamed protein product [Chironomus riparius]|uniref:FXNA-like protease n=1 Tax=Chironomus riparius TaxID=315576 RepID=A0A9N9RT75_9DIPT|nr:unnamed protein product [Chironomus riparius]
MVEHARKKQKLEDVLNPNEEQKLRNVHQVHSLFFIIGILCLLFILGTTKRIMYNAPDLTDKNLPFVGIEAWKDLKALNDMGPKVTGTKENEVLAVNYIKKRIDNIIKRSDPAQSIQFDHQIVSGSFHLNFDPGMAAVYQDIQNLVVRVEGDSPNALLINCHFDSVFGSPGANDDIANCAIMLEILSILSIKTVKNRHTIVFLFNGAEEMGLKGAHGFITKHKWAKDCKVLINLEAAGSGGKEILFQSGPGNSWLINHYHSVRRPFAQVSSEEIFQSGVIPSDTDYRIFRDFGNMVGLDFAHFVKGYRYHTKFDHIDYLSIGNIQRTGENVLELALSIANGDELDNLDKFDKTDLAVYFDYLGIVLVNYTKEIGSIINFIVTILAITVPYLSLKKSTVSIHSKHILKETFLGLISMFVGIAASLLVCYVTAYFLDKTGHSMSWYRNNFMAIGIYSSATVWFLLLAYDVFDMVFASKHSPVSLGLKVQARINGVNILWGILTLGLTILGIRSAYLFMIVLLINLFSTVGIFLLKLQNSVHKWLYVFLIGQIFITLWASYFKTAVTEMFIPITGRIGNKPNPDAIVAVISCVTTVFIVSYFIPLTHLLKGKTLKYTVIMSLFFISIFVATSTSIGFPYQDESTGNPVVQRHYVVHTTRTFYDINGHVRKADSGILFIEWDRNCLKTIEGVTMPVQPQTLEEMCDDEPFCGLPIVFSRMFMFGMKWLPSKPPKLMDYAVLNTYSKTVLSADLVNYQFTVNSTKLMGIYVHPRNGTEMVGWSFSDEVESVANKTYLAHIAFGIPKKPLYFDITLKTSNVESNQPIVDVNLVTLRSDRQEDYTDGFKDIIKRFPSWSFPVPLLSGVSAYQF